MNNGKIARLKRPIRDELNRRLHNGESAKNLLQWLNALPEVKDLLAAQFQGRPVSKQNLSEWKAREHVQWLARREIFVQAREMSGDASELDQETGGQLTDHLATILAARYAAAITGWNGEVTHQFRSHLSLLHGLCRDIVELRRANHGSVRLNLLRERLQSQPPEPWTPRPQSNPVKPSQTSK